MKLYLESKFVAINKIIITKILSIKINRRCIDVTAYNWPWVEIGFISKLWWIKNAELRLLISSIVMFYFIRWFPKFRQGHFDGHTILYGMNTEVEFREIRDFPEFNLTMKLVTRYFWENLQNWPIWKTFFTRVFSKFNSDFNCQFIWTF